MGRAGTRGIRMNNRDILVINGDEVRAIFQGQEKELIEAVRRAYIAHGRGASALPHSTFLRFPDNERNRIIALPAYLGEGFDAAGIKWISSFPGNIAAGQDR